MTNLMSKIKVVSTVVATVFVFGFKGTAHADSPQTFMLQGTILTPTGLPQEATSVAFTIEIRSPGMEDCLLYREAHTLNMANSGGAFSLAIGSGTRTGGGFQETSTLKEVFDNAAANRTGLTCVTGTDYDATSGHTREIAVTFNDGGGPQTLTQVLQVQSVPYALYAENAAKLGGFLPTDLVRVNTLTRALSQSNLESVFFNQARVDELNDLLDGASSQYVGTSSALDFTNNITMSGAGTSLAVTNASTFGGIISANNNTASTSSSTGAVVVTGGLGVGGAINSGSTINAATSMRTPIIYGSSAASGTLTLQSTSDVTKGNILINPDGGNVGVGTSSPAHTLDVIGAMPGNDLFRIQNTSSTGYTTLNLTDHLGTQKAYFGRANSGASQHPGKLVIASDGEDILFDTSITGTLPRLTIGSNGNVGIGTTAPTYPLSINGTTMGLGSGILLMDSNGIVAAGTGNSGMFNNSVIYGQANAGRSGDGIILLGIGNAGRLGAADQATAIGRNNLAESTSIVFGSSNNSTGATNSVTVGSGITNATAGSMMLGPSDAAKMTILSSGNVGVGTTTPGSRLEVRGSSTDSSGGGLNVTDSAGTTKFFVRNDGNIGIGTLVPNAPLNLIHTDSATAGNLSGILVDKTSNGASAPGSVQAVTANATSNVGSGSIYAVTAFNGGAANIGTTNVANAYTVASYISATSSGDIVNGAHFWARTPSLTGTGVITTAKGIQIDEQKTAGVSAGYGVYQSSPLDFNYFAGRVGVGTSTPSARLDLGPSGLGFNYLSAASGNFFINVNGDVASNYFGAVLGGYGFENLGSPSLFIGRSGSGAAAAMVFQSGGSGALTERMRIAGTGNIGIGVTDPGSKLQIAGDVTPDTTATKNLGSSLLRWNNIYLSNAPDVSSDARLKKDVENSDLGLDFINSLRPVSWVWKDANQGATRHYGVIAQETADALTKAKGQETNNVIVTHDETTDSFSVRYTELISPLIKAIQELYSDVLSLKAANDAKIRKLEAENASQAREIEALRSRLERIEQRLPAQQ